MVQMDDPIIHPVSPIAWKFPHCLVRAIFATAMCVGKSVGKAVSVGCWGNKFPTLMDSETSGKKANFFSKFFWDIRKFYWGSSQPREKIVLSASFLQIYQRHQWNWTNFRYTCHLNRKGKIGFSVTCLQLFALILLLETCREAFKPGGPLKSVKTACKNPVYATIQWQTMPFSTIFHCSLISVPFLDWTLPS